VLRPAITPASVAGGVLRWSGALAAWGTVGRLSLCRTSVLPYFCLTTWLRLVLYCLLAPCMFPEKIL
jgi:hypothetical protein